MSKALALACILVVLLAGSAYGAGRTYPKMSAPSSAVEMPLPFSIKLDATYLNFLLGELAQAQFSYAVKADPPAMAERVYLADSSEKPEVYEAMPAMPALEAP